MARRRRRRSVIPSLILLFLSFLILACCVLLLWKAELLPGSAPIEGCYVSETELSDEAAAAACLWLSSAQGRDLSAAMIREKMGTLPVKISLKLEKTDRNSGNFSEEIDRESYEAAYDRAYDILAQVMTDLIAEQYEESLGSEDGGKADAEKVNQAVLETYGKPLADYLKECSVELIPSYGELAAAYEKAGQYRLENGVLTLGNEQSPYVLKKDMLVLSDMEPSVYKREVAK